MSTFEKNLHTKFKRDGYQAKIIPPPFWIYASKCRQSPFMNTTPAATA